MDTADRAPDKSTSEPMTRAPAQDRNTRREREPALSQDHLPPSVRVGHYRARRNSPRAAPKNLQRASESQLCDRNAQNRRFPRLSLSQRRGSSRSPRTLPPPPQN